MKYLKKFNESNDHILYQKWHKLMNTIKDCFVEFEDNGWYWVAQGDSRWWMSDPDLIPYFNFRMEKKGHDEWPTGVKKVNYLGVVTSNGEIKFDDKIGETEEVKDFIVSIKRVYQLSGVGFRFYYQDLGNFGREIIINGKL